jgi:hypothetical protein
MCASRHYAVRVMAFQLPSGWYEATINSILDDPGLRAAFGEPSPDTAWKYVLAAVLWSENRGGVEYLHLNDRLRTKPGMALAKRGASFLEENFANDPQDVIDLVGKAYSAERVNQGLKASGWQRNNVTGASFEVALQLLTERINGVKPKRTPPLRTLRGFELAPVGYHSEPDLVLFSERDFRMLISTKWSLRKERIGTYLHEAWFYRQRKPDLQVAFVVGEFNLNILEWLVLDPLVDRVYHVHLPMLLAAHEPFESKEEVVRELLLSDTSETRAYQRWVALKNRLFDLSDLFNDVNRLDPSKAPVPDQLDIEEAEVEDEASSDGDDTLDGEG